MRKDALDKWLIWKLNNMALPTAAVFVSGDPEFALVSSHKLTAYFMVLPKGLILPH